MLKYSGPRSVQVDYPINGVILWPREKESDTDIEYMKQVVLYMSF